MNELMSTNDLMDKATFASELVGASCAIGKGECRDDDSDSACDYASTRASSPSEDYSVMSSPDFEPSENPFFDSDTLLALAAAELSEDEATSSEDLLGPTYHDELLKDNEALRKKLVLHRGYHSIDASYNNRPLENTRQAYVDSARTGARFAECDVWTTKDGVFVLSHNFNFASAAVRPHERLARLPIVELEWSELSELELQDGSTPVKLDTVLEDLLGTETRLVIELKISAPAAQLAAHLAERADLARAVAWVMSFSIVALELFADGGGVQPIAWLLDNPSVPFTSWAEGETRFDCVAEDLGDFLVRIGVKERIQELQCGLYLQYNASTTPAHLRKVRADMIDLSAEGSPSFLGLWSHVGCDPSFDNVDVLTSWLDVVDVINTDLPHNFWLHATIPPEPESEPGLGEMGRAKGPRA